MNDDNQILLGKNDHILYQESYAKKIYDCMLKNPVAYHRCCYFKARIKDDHVITKGSINPWKK